VPTKKKTLNNILLFLLISFSFQSVLGQQESIKKMIDLAYTKDQHWRNLATQSSNHHYKDSVHMTDSLNFIYVNQLINEHGVLGINDIGEDHYKKLFLLVQHCDNHVDFQAHVLSLMMNQIKHNNVSNYDIALLTDRVEMNMGRLIVFGTQMEINEKGNSFAPIECIDPEKLNIRRKKMGLNSIEESITEMNNSYSQFLSN
jgi:hypothetical protein